MLGAPLCFVLLLSTGLAISGLSVDTMITIDLDKNGNAEITEDSKLTFQWDTAMEEFNRLKDLGTTDIIVWRNFSENIDVHVLGDRSDLSVFTKQVLGLDHVVLQYNILGFATYVGEIGRSILREVNMDQFSFYNKSSGSLLLPDKTSITVTVEDTRKNENQPLDEIVETTPAGFFMGPYIQDTKIVVFADGPMNLNEFKVQYKVEKGISESWGFESLYLFFVKNPIYGITLLVLIALTVIYRRKVIGVLSESFAGEEDIEMPKREL